MNLSAKESVIKQKPFLRWAGGKIWLIKHLQEILPTSGFNNYHEPFLGGGAVFLNVRPENRSFLSDLNIELIATYQQVKQNVEAVIQELESFKNEKEFYYTVRQQTTFKSEAYKAARFIFLNQTSFNGIYRVNLNGNYNVPYGYRSKNFLEPEKLRAVSTALKKVKLESNDFMKSLRHVKKGDLVFLDPPYNVTHFENGFVKYNSKLFSPEDQLRLAKYIDEVHNRGAYYILTNAKHPQVQILFEREGSRTITLNRASSVGGKHAQHGIYPEQVFTNIVR